MVAEKVIRDPVHDVIAFRIERPVDGLLFRLLNAAEFQRLRRIRQVGLASLAYPGADHSRYSHSLGVMETARKILAQLAKHSAIGEEDRTLCLVGALLHDLGHGPFSHVFERVTGVHHEEVTRRVIQDPASEIHRVLAEHDRELPQRLLAFMECHPMRRFLNDILSSSLDADRCDYLLRDNLMTGSRYGDFDLSWLIQNMTIDEPTGRLAIGWKGISAVEGFLQARYHMYRNVYFHKVVRSGEGMVRNALHLARRLAVQGRLSWPGQEHPVFRALVSQFLPPHEFVMLDDSSITECFKAWAGGDEQNLARLCRGILFRRLFKVIDLSDLKDPTRLARLLEAARHAVAEAGGDARHDLFLDEPADSPYEIFTQAGGAAESDSGVAADSGVEGQTAARTTALKDCAIEGIIIRDPAGRLRDFSELSPMMTALNQRLGFRRLHVAPSMKGAVMRAIARVGD